MTAAAKLPAGPSLFEGIAAPLLDAILSQVPVGLTIATAPDVEIVRVSDYGSRLLGRHRHALERIRLEQHVEAYQVYDPATLQPASPDRLPLTRATTTGEIVQGEEWLIGNADQELVPILCNAGPIRDQDGAIVGGVITWSDLTRQKKLEEQLRTALAERDLARAELNHRVKNHLALVAAMVRLEARGQGAAAEQVAAAVSRKISALANAYSALEGGEENAAPAADLLRAVAEPLATRDVAVEVRADADLLIPADQCAPISIIVNEAICNALKHGFPDDGRGTITVALEGRAEAIELVIANDGLPLPPAEGQGSARRGRGSRFIGALVRQLAGSMSFVNAGESGVAMTIRFPRQPAHQRAEAASDGQAQDP